MAKLIVSIDGVVIREIELTKERTSVGRRPYNDVVIDNLAVSGEHVALVHKETGYFVEDLDSTNGTYLNGKAVKYERLSNRDIIEIGKYRIKFLAEDTDMPGCEEEPMGTAFVRVVSGAAAGRDVMLTKVVTTIGKPGVAVAAITKRMSGYVITHVDGDERTLLNGEPLGQAPMQLESGDQLELAGTRMQFRVE